MLRWDRGRRAGRRDARAPPAPGRGAAGRSIPLRRGHAIRSHRRWIGPDAAAGRNGQRPRPLASRRAEHGARNGRWNGRKAAHWRGWAVRRLLSERCVFRDVRWIGAKHHATSLRAMCCSIWRRSMAELMPGCRGSSESPSPKGGGGGVRSLLAVGLVAIRAGWRFLLERDRQVFGCAG